MSHYSGQNAKLKTSGIHYELPVEEPLKVEEFEDFGEEVRKDTRKGRKGPTKTWSLCKWFCVILAVLLSSFLITFLIAATYGYMWASRHVKRITADQSMQLHLPIHIIPNEEMLVTTDRAKLFYDLIVAGKEPEEDFSITADEINGFIAHSDFLRGNAYATISEDDKFTLDMSLPTAGLPGGKDRYFVSTLSLGIASSEEVPDNGALVTSQLLTPYPVDGVDGPLFFVQFLLYTLSSEGTDNHDLVANIQGGKFLEYSVPDDYIATKENLLEYYDADTATKQNFLAYHPADTDTDEDCMKFLNGIKSVSIKDGAVTVHARRSETDTSKSLSSEQVTTTANGGGGVRKLRRLSKFFF